VFIAVVAVLVVGTGQAEAKTWGGGRVQHEKTRTLLRLAHQRLVYQVRDGDIETRRSAALTLGRLSPQASAVVALRWSVIADPDQDVRKAAAQSLGKMGRRARRAVQALMDVVLQDASAEVRITAARSLIQISPRSKPVTLVLGQALIWETSPTARRQIARVLGSMTSPTAVSMLIKALDGKREVRRVAARTLGSMGRRARSAAAALIGILDDSDPYTRATVIWALGRLEVRSATRPLCSVLESDQRAGMRKAAAVALGRIGAQSPIVTQTLERTLLGDSSGRVRWAAAWALGSMGPKAAGAILALQRSLLKDPRHKVRGQAALALGKMGPRAKSAIRALKHARRLDDNPQVRRLTLVALKNIGDRLPAARSRN
jgi:HEAT repeat protein